VQWNCDIIIVLLLIVGVFEKCTQVSRCQTRQKSLKFEVFWWHCRNGTYDMPWGIPRQKLSYQG